MKIDFTFEELKFIEKIMDNQSSGLSATLRKCAETFLIFNAHSDIPVEHKKLLFNQMDEWARTDKILRDIRKKCENVLFKCNPEKEEAK